MIRSDDNSSGPEDRPGTRAEKCWHREPGAQTIRLETTNNGKFLFPYHHLVFAQLADAGDGTEALILGFPSHQVTIQGKRLTPLLKALEDFSAAWVRALPPRFAAITPEGAAVVTGIEVYAPGESEGNGSAKGSGSES